MHMRQLFLVLPAEDPATRSQQYRVGSTAGDHVSRVINGSTFFRSILRFTQLPWLPRHQGTKSIMDSEERRNAWGCNDPLPWAMSLPVCPGTSHGPVTTVPLLRDVFSTECLPSYRFNHSLNIKPEKTCIKTMVISATSCCQLSL